MQKQETKDVVGGEEDRRGSERLRGAGSPVPTSPKGCWRPALPQHQPDLQAKRKQELSPFGDSAFGCSSYQSGPSIREKSWSPVTQRQEMKRQEKKSPRCPRWQLCHQELATVLTRTLLRVLAASAPCPVQFGWISRVQADVLREHPTS